MRATVKVNLSVIFLNFPIIHILLAEYMPRKSYIICYKIYIRMSDIFMEN